MASYEYTSTERALLPTLALLVPGFGTEYFGVKTVRERGAFDANPEMPQVRDFSLALVFTALLIVLHRASEPYFERVAMSVLSPEKREVPYRVHRFAHSLFKLIYFTVMTVIGFALLHDQVWFPTSLGGSGDAINSLSNLDQAPSRVVRVYVMMQFAFQAHSLVLKLLEPFDRQTLEVVVHDLFAMLLIGSSYLGNLIAIGTLIGFLNDACDMCEYIYFLAVDTDRKPLVATVYFLLLGSWGYLRLYVYPLDCVYHAVSFVVTGRTDLPLAFTIPIDTVLVLLMVLQTYWFCLFAGKAQRLVLAASSPRVSHSASSGTAVSTNLSVENRTVNALRQHLTAPVKMMVIGQQVTLVRKQSFRQAPKF